jgi:polynucleotide 5'-hydroxyl-kinase GRC3/NOL9
MFKLYSSKDGPAKAYLQPIISTPEWNQALSKFPTPPGQKTPVVMICGPKSSGKSTFAKLLTNRLLSLTTENNLNRTSRINKFTGVAILDLDPGQPEYSAQGQLSLIHLQEPNFGPPFTHPIPGSQSRIIRAHTVGAVTPSFDPILYMECALDLFSYYHNLLSTLPKCPLVINTPGWVLGTGLEVLVDLIAKCRPTEVIYMSQDGPQEVVETLQEAAKTIPMLTLPSQVSEYTTRTAAHLRTMQVMSYFHLKPSNQKRLAWDGRPLTWMPPWEIKYSGEAAGILGIMCYGEPPPPPLLLEAINGCLVAVVVVDAMVAIPGWGIEDQDPMDEDSIGLDPPLTQSQSQGVQAPLIVRTPKENLPYFNPANTISLSPIHSHCLGLALVRGIDVPRQRLQVLTPIPPKVIQDINDEGKSIVLVSGKFDTPGWAYIEELVQKDAARKETRKGKAGDGAGDAEVNDRGLVDNIGDVEENGESVLDVPWVEKLEGSEGRGIGARVWRVRRDLGRAADVD